MTSLIYSISLYFKTTFNLRPNFSGWIGRFKIQDHFIWHKHMISKVNARTEQLQCWYTQVCQTSSTDTACPVDIYIHIIYSVTIRMIRISIKITHLISTNTTIWDLASKPNFMKMNLRKLTAPVLKWIQTEAQTTRTCFYYIMSEKDIRYRSLVQKWSTNDRDPDTICTCNSYGI